MSSCISAGELLFSEHTRSNGREVAAQLLQYEPQTIPMYSRTAAGQSCPVSSPYAPSHTPLITLGTQSGILCDSHSATGDRTPRRPAHTGTC